MHKFASALTHDGEKADVPGIFQSGQMGQTVNLLAFAFGGSNPSVPTHHIEVMSLACCYSSVVEHFLGKEEVSSSSLDNSSKVETEKNQYIINNKKVKN